MFVETVLVSPPFFFCLLVPPSLPPSLPRSPGSPPPERQQPAATPDGRLGLPDNQRAIFAEASRPPLFFAAEKQGEVPSKKGTGYRAAVSETTKRVLSITSTNRETEIEEKEARPCRIARLSPSWRGERPASTFSWRSPNARCKHTLP